MFPKNTVIALKPSSKCKNCTLKEFNCTLKGIFSFQIQTMGEFPQNSI